MAFYNELNALIDAYINRNGVQAITGQILNGVLKAMVEQLGRGYTIMGAATPTTDPGTPDGPECYFASTPGTYTDFDGLQVVPGELALLCYTPTDGWTKATIYEGFQEVGATIDGNVGTPSVGVSYANGVLSFDFHNMKGNPGDAAGFGTIGADIAGGVGTPGVSVESSGPATAKNLQFHFTNLKGETGVTSVVATVDNTTGNPACTVSLVGQQLTLAFSGLKGAQGNTGSSVDYPFTIVNNLTTDDATQALSAAQGVVLDGKVTQLEAKVDGIPGSTTTEEIIRTDYTETSHTISAQGKWVSSPTGKSILVPVSPGQILKYQSGTNDAIVALLKTDTYVQGETADFCNDYQERFIPTDGQQVTLPTDCNYLYILVKTSSGYVDSREFLITQTPSVPGLTDKVEDLQDNITDLGQDISDLKDSVEDVEAEIGDMSISESVDLSLYEESSKAVDASGVWRVGTPKYKGVPVIPGRDYKIYAIAETLFSILAENAGNAGTSVDFATGYTSRIIIQDGDVYNFVAPVDALYLWVRVKDTSGNDVAPTIIESYSKTVVSELKKKMDNLAGLKHIYENIPVSLDSDGWEKPVTPGMVIALKKAAQASQIRYTAKKAYPTNTSPTTGAIGEHSGFPYSSTKEIRKYICWEVSQRTFMTAVNNQYGLFYTEDIASAYNISEYGYSYNGVNCGSYYGMVCSIFALWCLGFNVPWDTKQFAYLTKIGKLIRLENQTAQGVHICDLIWLSGHTRLVTGVQRDEWGNVINVKVTESASNVAVINYTAESFQSYLTSHNCILYRSTDLYKNTDYVPSEFVAVCGESEPTPYPYNDYICHYAGDYSAMRADQPTWINYSLGNYTGMKIRKDGATWITIPLNGDAHKVDITTYLDGAGKYEACLTDGVNDSELTHWQLVDAGCTYEDNGTTQKITFASSNGTPWWLQVCSDNGTAYCWYEITDADIAVGYVELDLASMITEQYGAVSGTMYIRVMYKADYGGVASEMVQM